MPMYWVIDGGTEISWGYGWIIGILWEYLDSVYIVVQRNDTQIVISISSGIFRVWC